MNAKKSAKAPDLKPDSEQMPQKQTKSKLEYNHSSLDRLIEGCQIIGFDWRYLYLKRRSR
jgi:hypothetical protein